MKKALLVVMCVLMITLTYSQTGTNTSTRNSDVIWLTSFGIGGSYNNYKNTNSILPKFSLPTLSNYSFGGVIEEHVKLHNALIGLNLMFVASEKRPANFNESLMNMSGELDFGYYILNKNKLHVAPEVGIGLYGSAVNLTQTTGYATFADVLNDKVAVNMYQNAALLNFCLRFDLADFTKQHTCLTTIKLGYKYGLKEQGWGTDQNSNSTFADSPKDRLNQYYLSLSLGLARARHHS